MNSVEVVLLGSNRHFMPQRGVGDKAVNQLEKSVNSKLEVTVARQIQAQFQTTAKQVLQVCHSSFFHFKCVVFHVSLFL